MEKNQKDTNGRDKIALQSKDDKNMSSRKSSDNKSDNKSVERKNTNSDDKKEEMKKVGDKKSPTAYKK